MKRLAIVMAVFCSLLAASGAAWCENKAPIPPNGTILDTSTGLVWLQNANCFGQKSWADAMSSAANLKSGSCGLTDGSSAGKWRLPTDNELIARQRNQQGFNSIQPSWYWSSISIEGDSAYAFNVDMRNGSAYYANRSYSFYVWPVRSGP